uniref:Uncharacterized protein n=1 Tax=Oryza brachyantha TaxID=4533 RepID=J3N524_ORYBR
MVAATQGMVLYMGSSFLLSPAPTSFATISDEFARKPARTCEGEKPIEPILDIGIETDKPSHVWRCIIN